MSRYLALVPLCALILSITYTPADAWYCRATSSTGSWGWGYHPRSLAYAKRRALMECAVRTPRNRTCYIRFCRR